MIRLLAWPQLTTAAAFVTAVTVVLNPVTPVLPDITVPALFPPAAQTRFPAPAPPERPVVAMGVPVPAATALPAPAIVAAPVVSRPDSGVIAGYTPAPAVVAAAPAQSSMPFEIDVAPVEFPVSSPAKSPQILPKTLPMTPTVVGVGGPPVGMAHTGDRPRIRTSQQPFRSQPAGSKPLPAAATDAPSDAPGTVEDSAVRARGRFEPSRPDSSAPATRGNRGPAERPTAIAGN